MNDFEYSSRIPERLRIALSRANMKQATLAELTGIDCGAISSYVGGRYGPKQDRIDLMAKVLDVSPAWLMGYDVPMERETTPPDSIVLTEGESMLLELFRRVPEEHQQMVLDMIRIALKQNQ